MQWSAAWVVPLSAAIIAAAATLITAYVGYAKDRRDQRIQILRDIEIAEKLPDGSRAREILITYAENRALLLPVENHVRNITFSELLDFVMFLAVMALAFLVPVTGGRYWQYILALGAATILLMLRWGSYRRRVNNLIAQYLKEQELPSAIFQSVATLISRSYQPWRIWGIFSRTENSARPDKSLGS